MLKITCQAQPNLQWCNRVSVAHASPSRSVTAGDHSKCQIRRNKQIFLGTWQVLATMWKFSVSGGGGKHAS